MTVEAFVGLPGAGKTYNMSRLAIKQMRKRPVYANYPLESAIYFKEITEILDVKEGLILIDEAGIYLDANAWNKIPFEFKRLMRQHRKRGLDLWYTAQDVKDVVTYLRRVTQFVHDHNRIWKFVRWRTYNPRSKEKYGGGLAFIDPEICKKYDTSYEVDTPLYMDCKA